MRRIKYTPAEYRNMLRMSHGKYLLVEGKSDKRVFQFLLHELFSRGSQGISRDSINIDSAEDLIQTDAPIGNRQKVEMICDSVQHTPFANKIVGFVDREFREFEMREGLEDKLNGHNISGRVVWSRGHSIENYFFDFLTLQDPLREHSDIDHFDKALDLFRKIFDSTLCLACAISLAAEELSKLQRLKGSINWKMVEITNSSVELRIDDFRRELTNAHRFTEEEYSRLIKCFQTWYKKVKKADISCIRWICHGHIGSSFIWAVYGRCVFEVYKCAGFEHPDAEVCKVLEAKESGRFRACINSWVRRSLDTHTDFPIEVLSFLELSIPQA